MIRAQLKADKGLTRAGWMDDTGFSFFGKHFLGKRLPCYNVLNFIQFLKNIQKFVGLSNDKRHTTLIELGYFKSQIQKYERQIAGLIAKRKNAVAKAGIKKAKMVGEKITESIIQYYSEEDNSIDGLEKIHNIVKAWSDYMVDLTYLCGQTNRMLGNIFN